MRVSSEIKDLSRSKYLQRTYEYLEDKKLRVE